MRSNTLKSSQFFSTKTLTSLSFLVAVSIVLARILGFIIPVAGFPALKINFSTIPLILAGILYGPIAGFLAGAISDIIGYMINPQGGMFFPGFTLSAALTGMIPGLVYKFVRTNKIKFNYNIINCIFILSTSSLLILAFSMKDVLVIDNGIFFSGNKVPIYLIGLFLLLTISYMILPIYISKNTSDKKKLYSFDKIYFTVSITQTITSLILNTYFLSVLFSKGFLIFLPTRIVTNYIMIPLFSIILFTLMKALKFEK